MPHLSLRVSDDLLDALDAEAEDEGVSRSDYIRNTLENRDRVEELERENERLRRQLRAMNSRERDVDEIVTYVEEERRLQQRREERRDAPVWTRAKWWLFGRSTDDADA